MLPAHFSVQLQVQCSQLTFQSKCNAQSSVPSPYSKESFKFSSHQSLKESLQSVSQSTFKRKLPAQFPVQVQCSQLTFQSIFKTKLPLPVQLKEAPSFIGLPSLSPRESSHSSFHSFQELSSQLCYHFQCKPVSNIQLTWCCLKPLFPIHLQLLYSQFKHT